MKIVIDGVENPEKTENDVKLRFSRSRSNRTEPNKSTDKNEKMSAIDHHLENG